MSIEINGQSPSLTSHITQSNGKDEARNEQTGTSQPSDRPGVEGDSVSITNTAGMLKHMEATLSSVPVVDQQRVADIKQALSNGTFNVNPDRIAAKMLNLESMIRPR